jgi:hypothetical protein
MAPSILESQPAPPRLLSNPSQKTVDRKIFPDGIKTSGQHPPLYHALRPYSEFPKEITGSTVWKAEDYTNNPERWVHDFSEEEIEELSNVADKFLAEKIPLTGISQVSPRTFNNGHLTNSDRITSPYRSCLSYWQLSAMRFLTARALFFSKAFQ